MSYKNYSVASYTFKTCQKEMKLQAMLSIFKTVLVKIKKSITKDNNECIAGNRYIKHEEWLSLWIDVCIFDRLFIFY